MFLQERQEILELLVSSVVLNKRRRREAEELPRVGKGSPIRISILVDQVEILMLQHESTKALPFPHRQNVV